MPEPDPVRAAFEAYARVAYAIPAQVDLAWDSFGAPYTTRDDPLDADWIPWRFAWQAGAAAERAACAEIVLGRVTYGEDQAAFAESIHAAILARGEEGQ